MVYAFLQELVQVGIYKRSQGRITRQVTFAVLLVAIIFGLWRLSFVLTSYRVPMEWAYGLSALLLAAGGWMSYRLVNVPGFADFLIAVEAEMNKVSWPSRTELVRSCVVVLVVIFTLAVVLFGFDFLWGTVFRKMGIL